MEIVDANVVLRYLLKDHKRLYRESRQIIEEKKLYVPTEVIAEIVYVLEKVYEIPRSNISDALKVFFNYTNVSVSDQAVLYESFTIYNEKNIDFVDALLVSYNRIHDHIIHSFDKKVNKLCRI
jgi:predicted nucleic-acid-binding protein